jgi:hypothetical protein
MHGHLDELLAQLDAKEDVLWWVEGCKHAAALQLGDVPHANSPALV